MNIYRSTQQKRQDSSPIRMHIADLVSHRKVLYFGGAEFALIKSKNDAQISTTSNMISRKEV